MDNGWNADLTTIPKDGTVFDVWTIEGIRIPDCAFVYPWEPNRAPPSQPETICSYEQVDYDGVEGWDPVENERVTHWRFAPEGPKG